MGISFSQLEPELYIVWRQVDGKWETTFEEAAEPAEHHATAAQGNHEATTAAIKALRSALSCSRSLAPESSVSVSAILRPSVASCFECSPSRVSSSSCFSP